MILWRISNHATLDGRGGLRASARWHTQGRPIVYLASTPAGSLLEVLVHLELRDGRFPPSFSLMKLQVPESVAAELLNERDLAPDWAEDSRIPRAIGDTWIDGNRSALLGVPSAIVPETTNWLLNPGHPDSRQITIEWRRLFPADGRLFRSRK